MSPVSKFRMGLRLTTVRVGLAMILFSAAWLVGSAWWRFSRYWTPLAMAISLSPGHIRTPEFQINVASNYTLAIGMGSRSVLIPCADGRDYCQERLGALAASWVLSRAGKVVANGRVGPTQGASGFGGFDAAPGSYVLDMEVLKNESRASAEQPYLMVYETGGAYFKASDRLGSALWTFLLVGPIGICAMLVSWMNRRQEKGEAFLRRFPLTSPGPPPGEPLASPQRVVLRRLTYPLLRRRPSQLQRASTSSAVLICATVLQFPFIVMAVFQIGMHPEIEGLRVHLVRPSAYAQPTPAIQPVVVRVAPGADTLPCPYVNGRQVSWDDLSSVLVRQLAERPPGWPVYVEGDPNLEWKSVVRAIDEIRRLGVQVVLIRDTQAAAP